MIIVCTLLLLILEGNFAHNRGETLCPKVLFDFIDLSLSWAPGLCILNERCEKAPHRWTIHGTWPTNSRGRGPQNCCFMRNLNETVIRKLYTDLNKNWPSLYGNDEDFWQHEWEKHGTCSFATKQLQGQENYFQQSLKLHKAIDLLQWLRKRSIVPHPVGERSVYPLEAIREAIYDRHQRRVRFSCRRIDNRISRRIPILQEVHFCFDKTSLQAIDCQRNDDSECGKQDVHYVSLE